MKKVTFSLVVVVALALGCGEEVKDDPVLDCPETADCSGLECGFDPVCGLSCGQCLEEQQCSEEGICVDTPCVPDCTDKECGDDGCGEECGTCLEDEDCVNGLCVDECTPVCDGRECGPDECGGHCGPGCSENQSCDEATGQCVDSPCHLFLEEPTPQCSEGMCLVPAGPFCMGCHDAVDDACDSSERPYRKVDVPAFSIDQNHVTVDMYGACVTAGACTEPNTASQCNYGEEGRGDHPVNCVVWGEAKAYCEWAGKRLCTEAEWEKAARGADGRRYPWGNEPPTCDLAIFNDGEPGCGAESTWPAGSKLAGASPYGALDMAGNVWDWVEDDWHQDYTGAPDDGSAWVEEPRGAHRVSRGGGFGSVGTLLRTSRRNHLGSTMQIRSLGMRCCSSD